MVKFQFIQNELRSASLANSVQYEDSRYTVKLFLPAIANHCLEHCSPLQKNNKFRKNKWQWGEACKREKIFSLINKKYSLNVTSNRYREGTTICNGKRSFYIVCRCLDWLWVSFLSECLFQVKSKWQRSCQFDLHI